MSTESEAPSPASLPQERLASAEAAQSLRQTAALVALGMFVSTFAQTMVLGRLPFEFLLKGHLHLPPEALAGFFALASLPWSFKPLAGLLSDSFPIFGTRRKHYLLLAAAASALLWWLQGSVPAQYSMLVAVAVAMNVALMIVSTATGGVLVEAGKEYHATGRLTSLRFVVMNAATLIAGPLGGFLAAQAFGFTALTASILCLSLIPATLWLLHEPTTARRNVSAWSTARAQLRDLLHSGTVWVAAAMLFLVQLAPGFATPLFFYQTDTLHFDSIYIGNLALASGFFGMLAALVYARVCKYFALRKLLVMAIALSVVSTLFYLGYQSRYSALVIESLAGFVATLAQLPLFDLAIRATPRGSEAFGYSLMMSVWNIGMSLSDVFGSWLYAHYQLNFMSLVWLNAGTTALVLLVIPFLPRRIVDPREEDPIR